MKDTCLPAYTDELWSGIVWITMRLKLDILGYSEIFWDNSEDYLTSLKQLDGFPTHFQPFSPIIGSLKVTRCRRTDGQTYGLALSETPFKLDLLYAWLDINSQSRFGFLRSSR